MYVWNNALDYLEHWDKANNGNISGEVVSVLTSMVWNSVCQSKFWNDIAVKRGELLVELEGIMNGVKTGDTSGGIPSFGKVHARWSNGQLWTLDD